MVDHGYSHGWPSQKKKAKPILRRVEGDAWNLAAWSAVVIKIQSVVISDHWYNQPFQSLPPDKFNIPSGKLTVCYWKLPFILDLPINSMVIFPSVFLLTFTRSPWIPRRCRGWPGRQLLQKKLTEFQHIHQSSPGVQKRSRARSRAASAGFWWCFFDQFSGEKIALWHGNFMETQIRSWRLGWNITHCQVRFALTRNQ